MVKRDRQITARGRGGRVAGLALVVGAILFVGCTQKVVRRSAYSSQQFESYGPAPTAEPVEPQQVGRPKRGVLDGLKDGVSGLNPFKKQKKKKRS
ncbi:MAG: hypothetical protein CMJ18_11525 [Phycisphaeraceae bacterium]|nr:hypothetical protein [Phycisphaeraceae bacterium]